MRNRYSVYVTMIIMATLAVTSVNCRNKGTDKRLKIINNSSARIYAYISRAYPDTSIPSYKPSYNSNYGADPGGTITYAIRGTWDDAFKDISKLEIFIYDNQVLQTTPIDTIRAHYMILKRYDLTYDSLKKMDWHVQYP